MSAGRGNLHENDEEEAASAPGGVDLYAVLGLRRECTDAELRGAYRRLAMIWHPDRCSASGSSARVQEAKERFQEIQGAYSVLSDSNKRFLYDVGVYDSDDDDADLSGMGDFLGEMADMMSQATPTESTGELRGAAAAVGGHVPGRPGPRALHRASSAPQGPGPEPAQHFLAATVPIDAVAAASVWKKQRASSADA